MRPIPAEVYRAFTGATAKREIEEPPGGFVSDGKLRRCNTESQNGKGDAAYILFPAPPYAGGFQNWQDGLDWENWRYTGNGQTRLSPKEQKALQANLEAIRKFRDEEQRKKHKETAARAKRIWGRAKPAEPNHPYLRQKGIKQRGLRQRKDGLLLAPMRDANGTIWNLQTINEKGNKRFLKGGRTAGLFFKAGPKPKPGGTIVIGEGVATMFSVLEATGLHVVAAMSTNNLLAVGKALRAKFSETQLIYVADHDKINKKGKRIGIEKATEAAWETGGLLAVPPKEGDDANDLFVREGSEAVQAVLGAAQPVEEYIAVIYITSDLPTMTTAAWRAVECVNNPPRYFLRGGIPIRIKNDDKGQPVLEDLNLDRLRHEVARAAEWKTIKQGVVYQAKPPWDVIKDMLATLPDQIRLPVLSRLTTVPTFASDGKLCNQPGYNPANKTYYAPSSNCTVPAIPERPSEEDVRSARSLLSELVCDFPFASVSDKTHAMALFLLPFARDMIAGPTPLHDIEAQTPGTGKGLLRDVLLYPSTAGTCGVVTPPTSDEEFRKMLTSQLLAGREVVSIDNATHLNSNALSAALTAEIWSDRLLSRNITVDLPVRVIWTATSNNPSFSTEIARRCVRIRLIAETEKPWTREGFRHPDLRSWVADQRGAFVGAALTIIRSWIVEGMPGWTGRPLGSFESWSRVMGGLCDHAGFGGFLDNLGELYEMADVEGSAEREFVALWWEEYQTHAVGVADLISIAEKVVGLDWGKDRDVDRPRALGWKLRSMRDRIVGGFRIAPGKKSHKTATWKLFPTKETEKRGVIGG
jgi:phage/plasmid primase-like uncharacterized protein